MAELRICAGLILVLTRYSCSYLEGEPIILPSSSRIEDPALFLGIESPRTILGDAISLKFGDTGLLVGLAPPLMMALYLRFCMKKFLVQGK